MIALLLLTTALWGSPQDTLSPAARRILADVQFLAPAFLAVGGEELHVCKDPPCGRRERVLRTPPQGCGEQEQCDHGGYSIDSASPWPPRRISLRRSRALSTCFAIQGRKRSRKRSFARSPGSSRSMVSRSRRRMGSCS